MLKLRSAAGMLAIALSVSGCVRASQREAADGDALVGAWRSSVQFNSGAFASVHDLEFMIVFNEGGTLTESSNYDAAPPVPPAYGTWGKTGPHQYEAVYEFYSTKSPAQFSDLQAGGGWLPAGRGRLVENVSVDPDGKSYRSTMQYIAMDASGNTKEGGGEATCHATRIGF
jgi:hypothetical protein